MQTNKKSRLYSQKDSLNKYDRYTPKSSSFKYPHSVISSNTFTISKNLQKSQKSPKISKISKIFIKNSMGLSITTIPPNQQHQNTHKLFLYINYTLLGSASSCIFLTLSLRLIPSLCGFLLILLHTLTISGAIFGCAAASSGSLRWYGAHMVSTVLTAIFQGAVSVLIFTRSAEFLGGLKSYVREDDGVVILRMAGGLCALIFCLEWVVLTLAFFLKYYGFVDGEGEDVMKRTGKVQDQEDVKDWPFPFQV